MECVKLDEFIKDAEKYTEEILNEKYEYFCIQGENSKIAFNVSNVDSISINKDNIVIYLTTSTIILDKNSIYVEVDKE